MSLKSEKELTFACVDNSRVFDCFHLSIALSFFSNKNWLCPVSPCQLQWHMQLIPRTGCIAIFQQMHSNSLCVASIRSRTDETQYPGHVRLATIGGILIVSRDSHRYINECHCPWNGINGIDCLWGILEVGASPELNKSLPDWKCQQFDGSTSNDGEVERKISRPSAIHQT